MSQSVFSRRMFLQRSAIGASVMLLAASPLVHSDAHAAAGELPDWTTSDIASQLGRNVLITGGNGFPQNGRSGLGYHGALALAQAGANVTIASRNELRGKEAVRRILDEAPGSQVRFETLDLSSLGSVEAFAQRMNASGESLDLLINNAGVMGRAGREVSVDGFERVFATNTLGHFALTASLMPLLKQGRNSRIVWVSSMRTSDELPLHDLQSEQHYDYARAYDQSKLAALMLAFEFDRRSSQVGWGVSSIASHPGVSRTNLIPDGPGLSSREGWRFRMLPFLFQPAAQGALPTLYAVTSSEAVSGAYYGPRNFSGMRGLPGVATTPDAARDHQTAASLWAALEQLAQVEIR